MKMILTSLLLLTGVATGLGGEPEIKKQSLYDQFLFEQLPYGSIESLISFQRSQARFVMAKIFNPEDINKYIDSEYSAIAGSETLEQAALRVFNQEMEKRTNVVDGKSLEIKYFFATPVGISVTPPFTGNLTFVPQKNSDGSYGVPSSVIDSLDLNLTQGAIDIWWPYISRATLVVLDQESQLVYKGDTLGVGSDKYFSVRQGLRLRIPKEFLTEDAYQVILTVALETGVSGMYVNGEYEGYPQGRTPLIGLSMINHKPTISVHGGAPFQNISLLRYINLNHPPHEELLTLDCVGSASWTDNTPSPVSFYKLTYGEQ